MVSDFYQDQHIFKGVFMRHLSSMIARDTAFVDKAAQYINVNAASMLSNSVCNNGEFGTR